MKKYNLFILVFGVVVMFFTSCKDRVEMDSDGLGGVILEGDNGYLDSIYEVAMSDLCADFKLSTYQAKFAYRMQIDASVETYVETNGAVFGDDVLVLRSDELGENGEGLSAMLSELNNARQEGAESLSRAYAQIRQSKRWKSPGIEALIEEERVRTRMPSRMQQEERGDENYDESGMELDSVAIEEADRLYGDSLLLNQISVVDLANEKGILVVGTTVNIFLGDSIQMAMPVTAFNRIIESDPSILNDLENNNATVYKIQRRKVLSRSTTSTGTGGRVPISGANDEWYLATMMKLIQTAQRLNLEPVVTTYQTKALGLLKSGWRKDTKKIKGELWAQWMLYANYAVDRCVINNGTVNVLICIYLQNRYRKWGWRHETSPLWQWMKYKYTFSIYEGNNQFPIKSWTNVDLFPTGSTNTNESIVERWKPKFDNDYRTYYNVNTEQTVTRVYNFHVYESVNYTLPKSLMSGEKQFNYGFETLCIEARTSRECYVNFCLEAESTTVTK